MKTKMQDTNIIGDTAKERRIDYDLIGRLNKECEAKARKQELEGRLAGKRKEEEEEEEKPAAEPTPTDTTQDNINYIKTPDELREVNGNYLLQKGNYLIDFEIHVPRGNVLRLYPGVHIHFTKDVGITCEGRFEASGAQGLEVLLTAKDKDEGWKNLHLIGGAEAILDYARFSYGKGRKDKAGHLSGGSIFLEAENSLNPNLTITNSFFENNSAEKNGGVICNYNGNVRIKEYNMFKNNSATYGGVIYTTDGDMTITENNRFENNSARYNGGTIYNYFGNVKIKENNRFENNSANQGGAIYVFYGDMLIKDNNSFKNNSAKYDGGAIQTCGGTLDIDESKNTFIGNKPDDIS